MEMLHKSTQWPAASCPLPLKTAPLFSISSFSIQWHGHSNSSLPHLCIHQSANNGPAPHFTVLTAGESNSISIMKRVNRRTLQLSLYTEPLSQAWSGVASGEQAMDVKEVSSLLRFWIKWIYGAMMLRKQMERDIDTSATHQLTRYAKHCLEIMFSLQVHFPCKALLAFCTGH